MTRAFGPSVLALAACSLLADVARAGSADGRGRDTGAEADACVDAYERAQEQRLGGSLMSARAEAELCAATACPAFIRNDCVAWRSEIDADVPSVAFDVTLGGKTVTVVRVLEGERVLAERSDGRSFEVDPGTHTFRFETQGANALDRTVVVRRGEKNRLVAVELVALERPASPSKPTHREAEHSTSALPWVLVGTGVLGVTAFTLLGSSGLSEEAKLERTCAPKCGEDELQSLKTKYLLADVSLAVGIGGLVSGSYLLLTGNDQPATKAQAFPLRVVVGPRGGVATVSGKF